MKIHLNDIQACAECPAYYCYLKNSIPKPENIQVSVVNQVIKRCYIQATETNFRVGWRSIIGQVDREVFKTIDLDNKEQYKSARTTSEYILSFLQRWYYQMYLPEHLAAYADISLTRKLGDYEIYDTIPLILVSEHPIIMLIDSIEQNTMQMYHDIKTRGLVWLASETLECNIIEVRHLTVKPCGGMRVTNIKVDTRKRIGGLESTLQQVSCLIALRANFLSITDKCLQCPFRRRCTL